METPFSGERINDVDELPNAFLIGNPEIGSREFLCVYDLWGRRIFFSSFFFVLQMKAEIVFKVSLLLIWTEILSIFRIVISTQSWEHNTWQYNCIINFKRSEEKFTLKINYLNLKWFMHVYLINTYFIGEAFM